MSMPTKIVRSFLTLAVLMAVGGCASSPASAASKPPKQPVRPEAIAVECTEAPKIDGVLDEACWRRAPRYALSAPWEKQPPFEPAFVQFAYDREALYVAMTLQDGDLIAGLDADQALHYRYGDAAELFLKPADQTGYWEFYAIPNGRRSSFYLHGVAYSRLPQLTDQPLMPGFRTAVKLDGTLNTPRDADRSWTAEFAIPWAELTKVTGRPFADVQWTVLAARYNYGWQLPDMQGSAWPKLSRFRFHLLDEYAKLKLQPATPAAGEEKRR